ncbi:MAG: hypothetical protein M3Z96_09060, partial [Pseudomonadota bacterium]|nr:hypothetical protein [Pseudomonadota bacterium]
SCGGLCADREEKRVTCGNEINRWRGKKQEQLDSNDPNQRRLSASFSTLSLLPLAQGLCCDGALSERLCQLVREEP